MATKADQDLKYLLLGIFKGTCLRPEFPVMVHDVRTNYEDNGEGEVPRSITIVTASGLEFEVTVELREEDP